MKKVNYLLLISDLYLRDTKVMQYTIWININAFHFLPKTIKKKINLQREELTKNLK